MMSRNDPYQRRPREAFGDKRNCENANEKNHICRLSVIMTDDVKI